jgi:hypothetical protein
MSETFGTPLTGPKLTTSPPTWRSRLRLRARQGRRHEVAADADDAGLLIRQRAGLPENRPRGRIADFEPALLEQPERGLDDARDLIGPQNFNGRKGIAQDGRDRVGGSPGASRLPLAATHAARSVFRHVELAMIGLNAIGVGAAVNARGRFTSR